MTEDTGSRAGRWLAIIVVAAMVVMWLYIFSGAARRDPPDSLNDPGFAAQAEPRCAEALDALDQLPAAGTSATAADRADVLDDANAVLTQLLVDLDRIDVDDRRDRELIDLWLEDWRTYLGDRDEFATALRADADAELLVTARAGRQITLTIDNFAEVNDMGSCVTPLDA